MKKLILTLALLLSFSLYSQEYMPYTPIPKVLVDDKGEVSYVFAPGPRNPNIEQEYEKALIRTIKEVESDSTYKNREKTLKALSKELEKVRKKLKK